MQKTSNISDVEPVLVNARMEPGRITLSLLGKDWELFRPADLESMWDAMTDDDFSEDERIPYWVELWPASLALAAWLQKQQAYITGKTCLDLGCGLGFSALAGSWLGARVIAMDYEAEALTYASRNTRVNAVPAPLWVAMDWRQPAVKPGSCDCIWGGDVMYENRFVIPVFDFINYALAPGGKVWIAEPGRDAYDNFKRALLTGGWHSRCVAVNKVEALHVQDVPVSVKLWELSRQ
ncbi:50S ribosomal protein L11 methyltransferase [Desulfovibrio sp. OttesenSCG-928-G15]|nr:50S ribosomal protein L11 methyltransferase [Desulfovibrio sp. OttesenSCG-928-G15]